jgi:hypothetical protein
MPGLDAPVCVCIGVKWGGELMANRQDEGSVGGEGGGGGGMIDLICRMAATNLATQQTAWDF